MTRTYKYFLDNQSAAMEIEKMKKDEVGKAIKITYDRIRSQFYILRNLHSRLGDIRNAPPTDSKRKIAKLLKIKSTNNREERLMAIIDAARTFIETDNFDAAKAILKQEV